MCLSSLTWRRWRKFTGLLIWKYCLWNPLKLFSNLICKINAKHELLFNKTSISELQQHDNVQYVHSSFQFTHNLFYSTLHTRSLLESVSLGFSASGSGPMLLLTNLTSFTIATTLSSPSLRTFQFLSLSSSISSSVIRSLAKHTTFYKGIHNCNVSDQFVTAAFSVKHPANNIIRYSHCHWLSLDTTTS